MAINDRIDDMVSMLRDPEEDLADALEEYIWSYYRYNSDAVALEPEIVTAFTALFTGLNYGSVESGEELIVRTERKINARGGVYSDSDRKRHKVNTLPDYVLDEDEDED